MDKQRALEKIRKCLALAGSSNPHEAARAVAQAQALMRQHGVSEKDVELADVAEASAKTASVVATAWDSALARLVAGAFGCECFRLSGLHVVSGLVRTECEWIFVGIDGAPDVAVYAYSVLLRKVSKARRDHMAKQPKSCKPATKTARGDAFANGWVYGVSTEVQRFSGTDTHTAKIAAYTAQRWPKMTTLMSKDRVAGRNVRPDSCRDGYAEGQKAKLHGAVGGASAAQLRIGEV